MVSAVMVLFSSTVKVTFRSDWKPLPVTLYSPAATPSAYTMGLGSPKTGSSFAMFR